MSFCSVRPIEEVRAWGRDKRHAEEAIREIGSEVDAKTQAQIDRGKRIVELFKQPQYNPIPVEIQVAVIWLVQNQYADDVPVERIKEFQAKWTDFLTDRQAELLKKIAQEKELGDAIQAELKSAADAFIATWQ